MPFKNSFPDNPFGSISNCYFSIIFGFEVNALFRHLEKDRCFMFFCIFARTNHKCNILIEFALVA